MRYQAPYGSPGGPNDTTALYINGNPDTGTQGSCPPGASIEYPQREIVNFITDAGAVVPADTDLHQLAKTIQSDKTNFGVDIGTVNAVIVVLAPVPDAYYSGMVVRFRAKFAPTGPATLDAGRGAKPIAKSSGGVLSGAEWSVGDIVSVTYDSVLNHWQLPVSPYASLYAARNYYVNATTGSDSNDGLSAGTPFLTLQKAQNTTALFNLNGFNITINVANGTYAPVVCGAINGSGSISYIGNITTPSSCVIATAAGAAVQISGKGYSFNGFRVTSSGRAPGIASMGMWVANGSADLFAIDFNAVLDFQCAVDASGYVGYRGPFTISGSGSCHIFSSNNSYLQKDLISNPTLSIPSPVSFTTFVSASDGAVAAVTYSTIVGAGNVTGSRYSASANGVVSTNGGGANYLPGTTAGTLATGGQYV